MSTKRKRAFTNQDAKRNAAIAGGTTLTALTANHAVREALREAADHKRVANSASFDDFLKTLQPGDILFSRSTGKQRSMLDVKQMLQGGMGSRHYHASMFIGKGRLAEHPGASFKSWMPHARTQLSRGEDVVAYRIKGASDAVKEEAVRRAKSLSGRPYASSREVLTTGLRNLLGFSPKVGGAKFGTPITCVTMPQTGYKEVFGERFKNITEMRAHPDMEMVSRLQRSGTGPKVAEKAIYRVGYGILKNAKWAALAGALAFGATVFARHMMSKGKGRAAKKQAPTKTRRAAAATPQGKPRFIRVHGRVVPLRGGK